MSSTSQPVGPGSQTAAPAHLRGLLDLARLVRLEPALPEVFAAVARTISQTLGFRTVAVNLYRPVTGDYQVITVYGHQRAREALLHSVTSAASWAPLLERRFRRAGVYFIPEGALDWSEDPASYVPDLSPPGNDETAWRSADALFVPLEGSAGRHYGIISVDEPESGRRPDGQELEVLSAFAAHAALAIENSHHLTELGAALVRHRAVIESSLDAVIAIDGAGRILEFNAAAEQTFGFKAADVVGRELAEVLMPADIRPGHRRALRRAIDRGDWRLLGRRIETTALRADGSTVPVELALTVVRGSEDEEPIVYGFVRDISERRRGEEQLAYLAYHDPLTGLPNRTMVEQQLELALARARRTRGSVVMMFIDLDDFKDVNDRLGHAAGDRLLAAVATRLRGALRDSDLLARQGGDEFLVLLSDLTDDPAPAAESVARKLLDALREPFVVAGSELPTGASIGISTYPRDATDTESLLRHADVAMYQAKSQGGGRLAFHKDLPPVSPRPLSIGTQLRRAAARSELELHYQPIWRVSAPRGIWAVEALIRWRHPDRGLLTPEAFMAAAQQGGAGDELMQWTLRAACAQSAEWERMGLRPRVSINVSPRQLLATEFAARVVEQIGRHDLPANRFMIELTESAWTVDAAHTLAVTADLRVGGVGLAIDDFGAGYTSLSRFRELDFDVIKLDRRLLVDVAADRTAIGVLRAILDLAHACGASIVAQGIEADEQLDYLTANDIFLAQGFMLGRPCRADELTPLLQERLIEGRALA